MALRRGRRALPPSRMRRSVSSARTGWRFFRRGAALLCGRSSPRQERSGAFGAWQRRLPCQSSARPCSLWMQGSHSGCSGAAQALFHVQFEYRLDFPAGAGSMPPAYPIAENQHNIKPDSNIENICRGEAHMICGQKRASKGRLR